MKLKLKLLLASMFFCSVIFAQGIAPSWDYRSDRAMNPEMKKVHKKVVTPPAAKKATLKPSDTRPTLKNDGQRVAPNRKLAGHKQSIQKKAVTSPTVEKTTSMSNDSRPSILINGKAINSESNPGIQKRTAQPKKATTEKSVSAKKVRVIDLKDVGINLLPSIKYTDKRTEKDLPVISPAEKQAKQNSKKN